MTASEARRQALLKFGNVDAIKEIYRDQRGLPFMETLLRDTRHALRRLRRTPAFTTAILLTLALGIGANTAIFGVIDSILIRPLAYPQAEALVGIWHTASGPAFGGISNCRFNGDRSILGQTMTINSRPHTVIGVMPEEFRFQREPEVILAQRFERNKVDLGTFAYQGIARLKPGVTMTQANADLARMLEIWSHAWPAPPGFDGTVFQNARFGPKIQPLKQEIVGDVGTTLWANGFVKAPSLRGAKLWA